MVRLAILKGDKSIDDLTSRLFDLRANATRMRAQASDALKQANPMLSDLEKLPPGSVVVVPDRPGATKAGESFSPTNLANMNVPQAVTDQVATFKSGLETVTKGATEQANATLSLVKDKTVAAAAANDPDLIKQLSAISDNAKAALTNAEAQSTTLQEGIAQLEEDLAAFFKLLSVSFQPSAQPAPAPAPNTPTSQPSPMPARNPSARAPVRSSRPTSDARPAASQQPAPRRTRGVEPQASTPAPHDSRSSSAGRPKPKTRRKK